MQDPHHVADADTHEDRNRPIRDVTPPPERSCRGGDPLLATVAMTEPGVTDRLLAGLVTRLARDGVRVLGAIRDRQAEDGKGVCDSDLRLLPNGPVVRITQDLGKGSTACRMDAGALEEAVGRVMARLGAEGADLIVLNKFGLSEAEGRGFRTLIAEALGRGIPVLTGVSGTHRAAFERFAEGTAIDLPPEEGAILAWCRSVAGSGATMTGEA